MGTAERHYQSKEYSLWFPFNWDPQRVGTSLIQWYEKPGRPEAVFPFNWDPQRVGTKEKAQNWGLTVRVSIQLGSPASGDGILKASNHLRRTVSIQLGSPASGDGKEKLCII